MRSFVKGCGSRPADFGLACGAWYGPALPRKTFYKGKTINFIIASAPGGGYDTYSRLVAGHIGQHLAGRPSVVPQNMPGAAASRHRSISTIPRPKDGTAIGMVDEAIYLNQILEPHEPRQTPPSSTGSDAFSPTAPCCLPAATLKFRRSKTLLPRN